METGGSDVQAGGWNQGTGTSLGSAGTSGTWNKSNAADRVQSSGWNQPKDVGASEDGAQSDPWGKAAGSSWGKGSGGGTKGGW
ncbi:uncharacterized protein LOC127798418 [Diospyros lotus]|uniref:uncharacterized protein LOC127798418 n=1 Tax=Diospyros lotus TaxID=55363 RepID=UPI00224E4082|nr:uncharacterized protein LOC127798418 [Diospyros lotus]